MLYITRNICELVHYKTNFFLPKIITNQFNFINAMTNIFINDTINNDKIKRSDFITKSLFLLIEKENLNYLFKWIEYVEFKFYLKKNIKKENNYIDIDTS